MSFGNSVLHASESNFQEAPPPVRGIRPPVRILTEGVFARDQGSTGRFPNIPAISIERCISPGSTHFQNPVPSFRAFKAKTLNSISPGRYTPNTGQPCNLLRGSADLVATYYSWLYNQTCGPPSLAGLIQVTASYQWGYNLVTSSQYSKPNQASSMPETQFSF